MDTSQTHPSQKEQGSFLLSSDGCLLVICFQLSMVHASALRLILAIPLALLALDKVARMLGRREQHKVASLVCLPPGDVLELKVELTGKVRGMPTVMLYISYGRS